MAEIDQKLKENLAVPTKDQKQFQQQNLPPPPSAYPQNHPINMSMFPGYFGYPQPMGVPNIPSQSPYSISTINTFQVQSILEDNKNMILKCLEDMNSEKNDDCVKLVERLHQNLVFLASAADLQSNSRFSAEDILGNQKPHIQMKERPKQVKIPWTEEEQQLFIEGLNTYGPKMQVRSHLQKHLIKESKRKQYPQLYSNNKYHGLGNHISSGNINIQTESSNSQNSNDIPQVKIENTGNLEMSGTNNKKNLKSEDQKEFDEPKDKINAKKIENSVNDEQVKRSSHNPSPKKSKFSKRIKKSFKKSQSNNQSKSKSPNQFSSKKSKDKSDLKSNN
ncbi:UNKNOWN [Stylonychia lemnae]|uniref:SS18 N-terminal domain-containing protein n=1 Tax=Stylonychia lemnae TaxID=5949 RepID=A0A077ZTI4_STYLE|nr:UNKNOWN [Stylonychia lemnae]|eukprot:CDW72645.1 UNKNOWN [Stylonychia lemnae]